MPEFFDARRLAESRFNLIEDLKRQGLLKSQIVEESLNAIPREEFLWHGTPNFLAYEDEPLNLGDTGQTISAPHMVVIMLEELGLASGMRVLEVGSGSGYNAALLGWIVSRGTKRSVLVTTVERNERLAQFARSNIARLGLLDVVNVVVGDGSLGYPQAYDGELYDRIVVAAAPTKVPPLLKSQLKDRGLMLIPLGEIGGQILTKVEKVKEDDGNIGYWESKMMGCVFVPLVSASTV
ncbi:MAG: protein-L-isoaspartate O-methyltransferase [Nitrososphaerota archaeon]|nr:protein-L-isoaspartate O-methyltransferase [Nitrososphaerota archaeon]